MFGLFKKKSEIEKLQELYQKLMAESFKLAQTNRMLSDQKRSEAEDVMNQIAKLKEATQ